MFIFHFEKCHVTPGVGGGGGGLEKCHQMSHGGGGGLKLPKKCHVLFECPLSYFFPVLK
jgi:hypothetical protein